MATRLRIVLVTCLLVFILMDANPVLAKAGGGKFKKLETRVKTLEEENECKTCSFIDQLKERLNKMEQEIADLKSPPTTLPPPTQAPTLPPAPECQNYQALTDGNRKITNDANPLRCDSSLGPGWFRFQGAAGTKMPTSCVPNYKCGTHATGWLNGAHPTVAEGKVTRQACFSWSTCCQWSINIQVRNCGDFFIYYINGTPPEHTCNLGYCGTD